MKLNDAVLVHKTKENVMLIKHEIKTYRNTSLQTIN